MDAVVAVEVLEVVEVVQGGDGSDRGGGEVMARGGGGR